MRPIIRTGSMPEHCEVCGAKLSKFNTSNKCYQCLKKESLNKRAQPHLCSGCGAQIDRAEKHWTLKNGSFLCNACHEDPKRLEEPRLCSGCGRQIDRGEKRYILKNVGGIRGTRFLGFLCNACYEERKKKEERVAEERKKREERVAEERKKREERQQVTYVGGFSGVTGQHLVEMKFEATEVIVENVPLRSQNKKVLWVMPYNKIKSLNIETGERVTATRMLLVGIYAFALKKKDRYLVVSFEDHNGMLQNPVFEGGGITGSGIDRAQKEIYKRIEQARAQLTTIDQQPQQLQAATIDVAEQIKKLGELRDQGLLTEQEFDSKKQELLARM
jgi:hypothetical protein